MRVNNFYEKVIKVLSEAQRLRSTKVFTVVKSDPTLRSKTDLSRGCLSFVMEIQCKVPENSYLFIGSGAINVPVGDLMKLLSSVRQIAQAVNYLIRTCPTIDEACLQRVKVGNVPISQLLSELRVVQTPVDYGGRIVIPGSSLKGAVRNRLELAFKPIHQECRDVVYSCFIRQSTGTIDLQRGWRYIYINGPEVAVSRSSTCDITRGEAAVCKVCDLLGTAGLASRVDFNDALPVSDFEPVEMTLEHGEHILAIPPGTVFKTEISFRNVSPEEAGLIFMALNLHCEKETPILIGRFKYRKKHWKEKKTNVIFGRLTFLKDTAVIKVPRFIMACNVPKELEFIKKGKLTNSQIVLTGREAQEFINHCIEKTREKFGKILHEFFLKCSYEEIFRRLEEVSEREYHV